MNGLKILSCVSLIALALVVDHDEAFADPPTTVSCGTAIDQYFTGARPGDWLEVSGTRLASRGSFGFTSFTMRSGFQIATTPLHTSAAANSSTFTASKGSSHYSGLFSEVFPGRGNGDVDRWDFWMYRTGALWLRSVTWGGSWALLQGTTCYRGPQNQTIVSGYFNTAAGTDFWTFVLVGDVLI